MVLFSLVLFFCVTCLFGKHTVACKHIYIMLFLPTSTDQPSITFISPNQTVNDSTLVWLDCGADSVPKATITWTRLSTNKTVGRPFNITGKQDQGIYRCTANNGIGNAATANVIVIVQCKSQYYVFTFITIL